MADWRRATLIAALTVAVTPAGTTAFATVGGAARRAVLPHTIDVPRGGSIQHAVDESAPGTLILIEPGVYRESVVVTRPDLVIRGADRNHTVLDGQRRRAVGIEVRANGVALENISARNYTQNGFYWLNVDGYRGSYLTASANRGYGIYAAESQHGQFDHSYVSGSSDSGFYIGACNPCHAVVTNVTAESNAVGFSGTNASGDLAIVASRWRHNRVGILPNSLDTEMLPPQDGLVVAGNEVTGAPSATTPHSLEFDALDGTGIALVGVLNDLITKNHVSGQTRYGILVAPNPGIEGPYRPSLGNQVRTNGVERSGTADLALAAGTKEQRNCFEDNQFRTTAPALLERALPCSTTGTATQITGTLSLGRVFVRRHPRASSATLPTPPTEPNMPGARTAPARPATAEPSAPVDLSRIVGPSTNRASQSGQSPPGPTARDTVRGQQSGSIRGAT